MKKCVFVLLFVDEAAADGEVLVASIYFEVPPQIFVV